MKNEIMIIDEKTIEDKIYVVRGKQVMIDSDLAAIYGYETKDFNDGAHSDERIIIDDAAVDDTAMPDGHTVSYAHGIGEINVQTGVVLNIRVVADRDRLIAPNGSIEPHTAVLSNCHILQNLSALCDEGGGINHGHNASLLC